MHLKRLSLLNFKNHRELDLALGPRMNCFLGPNGVGKTNLLDSVHYLSLCKSYFHAVDQEHILHNEDLFMIKGIFNKDGDDDEILCTVQRGKGKTFKRNKKTYSRLADHVGKYPVVMITPYDANLVLAGSDVRRRSLDGLIAQFDKTYLEDLMRYNKALAQRNQLLKTSDVRQSGAFEPWNEQLCRHAEPIHGKRVEFMNELVPLMNRYYQELGHESELIGLEYRSQLKDSSMADLLSGSVENDRAVKHTTVGIHKDDLNFTIGGLPLKRHGSQGQQKTFLIAYKLAHFDVILTKSGMKPILLLDDIFDRIDPARLRRLLGVVASERFAQILITDTDPKRLEQALIGLKAEVRTFTLDHRTPESVGTG